ncbi:MAG: hypothetical protein HY420_00285 [Candidatus Kerfeldbacteria bacterium]|nr:hypothetical protein [Candidatus Kerfeldbacteria bacterium]
MRGEGHSREGFEAAQREEAKGRQKFSEEHEKTVEAKRYRGEKVTMGEELREGVEKVGDALGVSKVMRANLGWERAENRLKQLMNEGHEEASELNKEYDRLRGEVARAMQAVEDFERDKLGMKSQEENNEAA